MRVNNGPVRQKQTRMLHARHLHAPGGHSKFKLATACAIQGQRREVAGHVAVLSPANHTYLIARPGEAVTCARCAAVEG